MKDCKKCGHPIRLDREDKYHIRWFKQKYPWCTQEDIATLLRLSKSTISEVIAGRRPRSK